MFVFLIPAYQPGAALETVVSGIRGQTDRPIVIVDDGSGAGFEAVWDRLAGIPDVVLLRHAVNLGKGAALKTGLNHILVDLPDTTSVVTADADGQHAVEDILRVARTSEETPGSLILGVRQFGDGTPFRSWFGNTASRYLYKLLLGISVSDTQTGLRGIPRALTEASLVIKSNRYEFETEQLTHVAALSMPIKEVPIQTIYEDENASSHFNPFFDSIRIYFIVLRYALSSMATAVVDFVMFIILFSMTGHVVVSNLGGRCVALVVQYGLLKSFVFNSGGAVGRFVLFVAYVMVMGLVSSALQIQLASVASISPILAKVAVESLVFLFNFLFLRDILFTEKRAS